MMHVESTWEGMLTIKTHKLPVILMKMDLAKAYDKPNLFFLRFLLL
jgi:hypothetical protein